MDILALDKEFLQSFNVSSLREFVDWQQLKKISETNHLQPDSTLALASFIGNITINALNDSDNINREWISKSFSFLRGV